MNKEKKDYDKIYGKQQIQKALRVLCNVAIISFGFNQNWSSICSFGYFPPASICNLPTFRNHVSVPSSRARSSLIHGSETSANYILTPGK